MTLKDKAATVKSEAELQGFIEQLKHEGRYDPAAANICEMRRAEIRKVK